MTDAGLRAEPWQVLGRIVDTARRQRAAAAERCDLCSAPVAGEHRHLLDEQRGELLCACRACCLLFEREAAGRGHYRLVPQRRLRLADSPVPPSLPVPVGLAFLVRGPGDSVVAHYPSPVGATRSEVPPATWASLVERWPPLADMQPAVEALLVNTARGARERWLVPVDDCFRLVAVVRREWRGLSGGRTVWPAIERFFADLQRRAGGRTAPARGGEEW